MITCGGGTSLKQLKEEVDSLKFQLAQINDYVISQGNGGGSVTVSGLSYTGQQWHYREWKSGFREVWGFVNTTRQNTLQGASVTWTKQFKDTYYNIVMTEIKNNNTGNDSATNCQAVYQQTVSGFTICQYHWTNGVYIYAAGYIS